MTLEDILNFIEAHKENWSNGKFFFIRCPSYYVPFIDSLYGFNPNCCWESFYCSKCRKEVNPWDIGEQKRRGIKDEIRRI